MTITSSNPTVLVLSGIGVPPYSARGLSQSLEPIEEAKQIERTINGELIDLSSEVMQKYKSTISGNDHRPPACDGVWPGKTVTVDCIAELCSADYDDLQRTPVPGSVYQESGFGFYRPRLAMMVLAFSTEKDEYTGQVSWSMDLEEV